jgi:hypothetical protein
MEAKEIIHNPIINGIDGSILMVEGSTILGTYSPKRMILRIFTGKYDMRFKEIWTGDKLFAKDNSDGEEYIGYVCYDEEKGDFNVQKDDVILYEFIPNTDCYVKGHIHLIVEFPEQEKTLAVGTCDFCEESNRYVKPLYDSFDSHVLDKCLYGCEDERSIPSESVEPFELISVMETYRSYCHDSKWDITVKLNNKDHVIHLNRLNSETEENLTQKVTACRNLHEIKRLNLDVFHN